MQNVSRKWHSFELKVILNWAFVTQLRYCSSVFVGGGGLEKTTRNLIHFSLCTGRVLKKVLLKYKSEV